MRHENHASHVYDPVLEKWVGGNPPAAGVTPTTKFDLRGDKIISLEMGVGTVYGGVDIVDYQSCCRACATARPPSPPPSPPHPPEPPPSPVYPPNPPPTPQSPFAVGNLVPYATASGPADVGAIAAGQQHECKGVVYKGNFCHLKTHYDVVYWPADHVPDVDQQEIMGDFVFAYTAPVRCNRFKPYRYRLLFTHPYACARSLFAAAAAVPSHWQLVRRVHHDALRRHCAHWPVRAGDGRPSPGRVIRT